MNSYNGWAQVAYREKYTTSLWEARKSYTETPFSLAHGIPGAFTMSLSPATRTALFMNIHIHMNTTINKNLHVCEQLRGLSLTSAPCKSLLSLKTNTGTPLSPPYTKRIEPRVSHMPGQCCTSWASVLAFVLFWILRQGLNMYLWLALNSWPSLFQLLNTRNTW